MSFSEGEKVHVKGSNIYGTVVGKSGDDEDLLLVRSERYYRSSDLELESSMGTNELEQEAPLERDTSEWSEEQKRFAGLLLEWNNHPTDNVLTSKIIELGTRLGLFSDRRFSDRRRS
jgi:hypothetical protein